MIQVARILDDHLPEPGTALQGTDLLQFAQDAQAPLPEIGPGHHDAVGLVVNVVDEGRLEGDLGVAGGHGQRDWLVL